ncbi:MAG: response regulator transcription factor [Magnetococcales bacterium]|nr:response regulator transcription factor [Magnetococcales bacterium]NGZ27851.1 response regulator transcription factor [Magnetococcales bacterium]
MRVLVVEDQRDLSRQVASALRNAGYVVDTIGNGEDALHMGLQDPYEAIILDLGLPGLDGLSVLDRWRRKGLRTPVLILSARDTWREKVTGLRAGADDYLAKPFEMAELLARVEVIIRRASGYASSRIAVGELALDQAAKQIYLSGTLLQLTAMEYRLLACLMVNGGRIISKSELAAKVYEQGTEGESNSLEVLILRLRKKIGGEAILTHRGLGYQLTDKAHDPANHG